MEFPSNSLPWQKTLKSSISCTGVGLHSGRQVRMTLHPAEPDTGIVFRRVDVLGVKMDIPARFDHVSDTRLNTTLSNEDGVSVSTVEHLMSALSGCEIDNLVIELDQAEVPVMDGSAEPFVFLIECAGILEQDAPRRHIQILKPVTVSDGKSKATLEPMEGFSVSFGIDFDSAVIGRQDFFVDLSTHSYKKEICRARTFGFLHEVEALWEAGLAKGGSMENAVVVNGDEVMNEGGLRYTNEFVRHKVLDCLGDLFLAGAPLIGHFHGVRSGHALHNQLLRTLLADYSAWAYVTPREFVGYAQESWMSEAVSA